MSRLKTSLELSQEHNQRVQNMRNMKLHEFGTYGKWRCKYSILKVPGGWIYSVRYLWKVTTIFIPGK